MTDDEPNVTITRPAELTDEQIAQARAVFDALQQHGALREEIRTLKAENDRLNAKFSDFCTKTELGDAMHGPDWAGRGYCNDGRVWAVRADDHRRYWLRAFTASALSDSDITPAQAVELAFQTWDELELAFKTEPRPKDNGREP